MFLDHIVNEKHNKSVLLLTECIERQKNNVRVPQLAYNCQSIEKRSWITSSREAGTEGSS